MNRRILDISNLVEVVENKMISVASVELKTLGQKKHPMALENMSK